MSITFYCGLPGHGKTLSVVKNVVVPNLEAGRHIITNIPLNLTADREQYAHFVQTIPLDAKMEDLLELDYSGKLLVLDEFWRFCPSGVKTNNIPERFKEFWAMHRHMTEDGFSTEIVVISQGSNQICAFVKSLIEKTFHVQKIKLGFKQVLKTNVYSGCYSEKTAQFIQVRNESYDKDYFKWYSSQTLASGGMGQETDSDGRDNLLSVASVKYGAPIGVVLAASAVIYLFFMIGSIFGEPDQSVPVSSPVPGAVSPPASPPVSPSVKKSASASPPVDESYELLASFSWGSDYYFKAKVVRTDQTYFYYDQDQALRDGFTVHQLGGGCHVYLEHSVPELDKHIYCQPEEEPEGEGVDTVDGVGAIATGLVNNPFSVGSP